MRCVCIFMIFAWIASSYGGPCKLDNAGSLFFSESIQRFSPGMVCASGNACQHFPYPSIQCDTARSPDRHDQTWDCVLSNHANTRYYALGAYNVTCGHKPGSRDTTRYVISYDLHLTQLGQKHVNSKAGKTDNPVYPFIASLIVIALGAWCISSPGCNF